MRILLRLCIGLLRLLPRPVATGMARGVGLLLYHSLARRRRIALDNLRMAFGGQWPEWRLRQIARRSFQHMVLTVVESLRLTPRSRQLQGDNLFQRAHYFREGQARGKGVVALVSHLGNWEVGAALVAAAGFDTFILARSPSSEPVAELLSRHRAALGLREIPRRKGVRGMMRALQSNSLILLALDQHVSNTYVTVPFFGRPAQTSTVPALLALRYGIPVIPAYPVRERDGRIVSRALPEVTPDYSGNTEEERVERTTRRYVAVLEDLIRQHPEQWLWMHRRWR